MSTPTQPRLVPARVCGLCNHPLSSALVEERHQRQGICPVCELVEADIRPHPSVYPRPVWPLVFFWVAALSFALAVTGLFGLWGWI